VKVRAILHEFVGSIIQRRSPNRSLSASTPRRIHKVIAFTASGGTFSWRVDAKECGGREVHHGRWPAEG